MKHKNIWWFQLETKGTERSTNVVWEGHLSLGTVVTATALLLGTRTLLFNFRANIDTYLRWEKLLDPFSYKTFLQYGVDWWSIPRIPFK